MSQNEQAPRWKVASISKDLRARILESQISANERFSTVEELAEYYMTSRMSIQRALDDLQNLVEVKPRKGIWIRPRSRIIVGVVVPGSIADNEFMAQFLMGCIEAAHVRKCHLMFEYTNEDIELEGEVVKRMAEVAQALIIIPTGSIINHELFTDLMKQNKLILFADRFNKAGSEEYYVHHDDIDGGRRATKTLLDYKAGTCNVVYFLGDDRNLDHQRYRTVGWRQTLQEYWFDKGIKRDVMQENDQLWRKIPQASPSAREIRYTTKKYAKEFLTHIVGHERKTRNIEDNVTDRDILSEVGIVAAYEFIGLGLFDYLTEAAVHHKNYPVRLCSYDGMTEAQALKITSVRQNPRQMGHIAVAKAYDYVRKGEWEPLSPLPVDVFEGMTHKPNWLKGFVAEQREMIQKSSS